MQRLFRGASAVSGASLSRSNRSISCSDSSRISPRIQFSRFPGGIRITVARKFFFAADNGTRPLLRFLPHHRAQPCCPSRSSFGNNVLMFLSGPRLRAPFILFFHSFFFFFFSYPFPLFYSGKQTLTCYFAGFLLLSDGDATFLTRRK